VFTFLEDGEGVDDVIKSADHVTPQVDDATNDNSSMKHEDDDANRNGEIPSPQPHTAVTTETDTVDNGLVTSSPAKAADDVADLEFRGRPIFTARVIFVAGCRRGIHRRRVSVFPSVTSRCCTEMAKFRVMQTKPHVAQGLQFSVAKYLYTIRTSAGPYANLHLTPDR